MSYVLNVRGLEVVVFMHDLMVYVLLPDEDLEARNIVVRSEKDILNEIREDFGREIRGIQFLTNYLH